MKCVYAYVKGYNESATTNFYGKVEGTEEYKKDWKFLVDNNIRIIKLHQRRAKSPGCMYKIDEELLEKYNNLYFVMIYLGEPAFYIIKDPNKGNII